jgi:hypothetical protein
VLREERTREQASQQRAIPLCQEDRMGVPALGLSGFCRKYQANERSAMARDEPEGGERTLSGWRTRDFFL